MLFTTNWLSTILESTKGNVHSKLPIEEITTDSRKQSNHSLFVPIVGDKFDGHKFIEQAVNNGAVATIWDEKIELPSFLSADFPVFFVKDTLRALQTLASFYRKEINPTVIGITGSNGKTTTKDIVQAIMGTTYKTHATKGNLNNHIGLPLTILSMERDTEVLVLEMGMNDFNEIDLLAQIAEPDFGIITNIGESHIEHLGSREGIKKAKLEILNGLKSGGTLIVDGDEHLLQAIKKESNVISCGFEANNDVMISEVKISNEKTVFQINNVGQFVIPLLGRHHAQNTAFAITLAQKLNINNNQIQSGLNNLHQSGMRFELINGKSGVSIINDAYNASPTSMRAAISVVKQMEGFNRKILVLGDVFELGDHSEELHRSIASTIENPITALFTYGEKAYYIADEVKQKHQNIKIEHFETKEALIEEVEKHLNEETLLLFKASRGMQFESIVEVFV